ncbi:hypothetical protein MA16_Dca020760 [Dendrobium catenatum]|uniref:Uncharacterized protein n=1 Tax=Dendrobium catenatum TaxID=906689 RepID=A0A2I0WDN3_9ASPA|nr:hypothetical protein MA16_Dca020760 [Dendrobium catenatum]
MPQHSSQVGQWKDRLDPVYDQPLRIAALTSAPRWIASGDGPPHKSFASKFYWKKFTVTLSRATQPVECEGPSVPPVLSTPPPPPRGQQQSPSEQGQGQSDPPTVHEHGGPSKPLEVDARDHATATDKRQYIEPEGDKMILYKLEKVGSPLARDHLQDRPTLLSIIHGQMLLVKDRGGIYVLGSQGYAYEVDSSTSAFYDPSGAEETVSQRVAALTREIEEMRRVQNEMQAELQSYRVENQRKQEEEQ